MLIIPNFEFLTFYSALHIKNVCRTFILSTIFEQYESLIQDRKIVDIPNVVSNFLTSQKLVAP